MSAHTLFSTLIAHNNLIEPRRMVSKGSVSSIESVGTMSLCAKAETPYGVDAISVTKIDSGRGRAADRLPGDDVRCQWRMARS